MTHPFRLVGACAGAILLFGLVLAGCQSRRTEQNYRSPYPGPCRLAVMPFINQSGSAAVDMMAVTDEFYSELQQVEGLQVTPVNQVLAAMNQLGLAGISSPGDAMSAAEALGVDGVIVGSITQYDPYPPPRMGMAVELFIREQNPQAEAAQHVDPGRLARAARPFELKMAEPLRPQGRVVRIMDAAKDDVVQQIKQYARYHGADNSPAGWKKYTTRRNYLRFVSHAIIGELLAQERQRLAPRKQGDG